MTDIPYILLDQLPQTAFNALLPILIADDADYLNCENNNSGYEPCSFTIAERMENLVPLNSNENNFSIWLKTLINDAINRFEKRRIFLHDKEKVAYHTQLNILYLLESKHRGKRIATITWNQEMPDIVAKVLQFTIGNDPRIDLDTHYEFNKFALNFIPEAINRLGLLDESEELLLKFAVASGLSGLDLKGAVAAASEYAQLGIKMAHINTTNFQILDIDEYCENLKKIVSGPSPLFHFSTFIKEMSSPKQLIWFTDDVIESIFDLFFIQKLLLKNPLLKIILVPKNGKHANDFGWQHLEEIIQHSIFKELRQLISTGRFKSTRKGARMSTININKLDKEVHDLLNQSDFAVIKGCRAHEMTQGGFLIPTYTAYVVARSFSEVVSGFDACEAPLLFFRTNPGEFSFYGFTKRKKRPIVMKDGRTVFTVLSTTKEHYWRVTLMNAKQLSNEFENIISDLDQLPVREKKAAIFEANNIAIKLIDITRETYNKIADAYSAIRWEEPHELDKKMWFKLIHYLTNNIKQDLLKTQNEKPYLLDIGAGNGRDLKYAQKQLNFKATSIDNSTSFVNIIKKLEAEKKLAPNSIFWGDMCDLSMFGNKTFDAIRHNATLLHMPLIAPGYMADKAVSECFRVLKPGGILYIFVKEGTGVGVVDTGEGLGERFYQFYNKASLATLLERNNFTVLEISCEHEKRGEKTIPWLAAFATKKLK